jgi:hypothetical protein
LFEIIFAALLVGLIIFPALYTLHFKLRRKLLFLAACYGLEQIIFVLLLGLASPLILMDIFVFPQLETNGSMAGISWLAATFRFVEDYWYWVTFIILVVVPFPLHNRYRSIFDPE